MCRPLHSLFCFAVWLLGSGVALAQAPVVVQTNATIRIMAANITSGNFQRYETPGLNLFKGLKPDVVAVQEFNYAGNAFRDMINEAFGTNFVYFRESAAGYSIPNGIISRWPILDSGSWDDVQVPDRGFAWALIDIPGPTDLFVVSVHLHSSGGASSRAIEAANLKALIQSSPATNAFLVVAGDFNTDTRTESCVTTMKTFLSDSPIPHDGTLGANPNSNASRLKPYDYVLADFILATNHVPTVLGPRTFPNGLIFDSRVYTNLADVGPVQAGDSAAVNMQHMAVVKDFRVSYTVTNMITVPRPWLTMAVSNVIRWEGVSQLTYTVQASSSLTNWAAIGIAFSATTNFSFNLGSSTTNRQFFRVLYP